MLIAMSKYHENNGLIFNAYGTPQRHPKILDIIIRSLLLIIQKMIEIDFLF